MQLPTDLSKDILPVLPDDYVYFVDRDQGFTVRTARVAAVVIGLNNQLFVRLKGEYKDSEIGKDVYLTAEEAEVYAAAYRPVPPYYFHGTAVLWMPAETWFPAMSGNYGIMHKKEDGSVEKIKAYYDNGAKYEDECGYYESERRSARRIENVIAWIGTQFMDTDEWYDRRPLDFSYSPLEELDLGVSAYNLLEQQGFNTIRDLLKLPDHAALEKVCNHRKKIIEDVIQHLEAAGFKVDYLK